MTYERRVENSRALSSAGVGRQAKRETALVSYNDLDATLTGRIMYTLTPTPSFENDTLMSNYFSRRLKFHLQDVMSGSTPKKPVSSRAKERN